MENVIGDVRALLCTLVDDLNACDPHWVVFGSAAIAFCGYDVEVHDVDVMMSLEGLEHFRQRYAFCCECLEVPDSRLFRSRMSRFRVHGRRLEVCGPLEVCEAGRWQKVQIDDVITSPDGIRYCSAEECKRLLRLFGRPKDLVRLQLMSQKRI